MEEAIMEFQNASAFEKHTLRAYGLLGMAFKRQGFDNLAIKQFQRALELDFPDEDLQEIRYNLAQTYQEQGTIQEALIMYQECYAIDIRYKDVSQKINELSELVASESEGKVIPLNPFGSGF